MSVISTKNFDFKNKLEELHCVPELASHFSFFCSVFIFLGLMCDLQNRVDKLFFFALLMIEDNRKFVINCCLNLKSNQHGVFLTTSTTQKDFTTKCKSRFSIFSHCLIKIFYFSNLQSKYRSCFIDYISILHFELFILWCYERSICKVLLDYPWIVFVCVRLFVYRIITHF